MNSSKVLKTDLFGDKVTELIRKNGYNNIIKAVNKPQLRIRSDKYANRNNITKF